MSLFYKKSAVSDIGVILEKENALLDARDVIRERGQPVKIVMYEERKIERDRLNTVKKNKRSEAPEIIFYAHPVIYNPTAKQSEEAGLKEQTQVLIKTAVQDWIDNGYTVENLKMIDSLHCKVIIAGAKYEIKDKALSSQFSNTYLYINLGLNEV